MELPDWIWDEAHAAVSAGAFSLLIAVVRYGDRDVDPNTGGRRWKMKRTIAQLAAAAHIPKRTAERAIAELTESRFMWVSNAVRPHAQRNFIVLLARGVSANLADSSDVKVGDQAGGVKETSRSRFKRLDHTTTTPDSAKLADWLAAEEVADGDGWVNRYGGERVYRCLYQLDYARELGRDIKSPAGFLFTLLESSVTPLPVPWVGPPRSFRESHLDYIREHQRTVEMATGNTAGALGELHATEAEGWDAGGGPDGVGAEYRGGVVHAEGAW